MLNRDERVAMMTPTREINLVSPPRLSITLPRPTSPTPSDADSESLDDGSNSPCSFSDEECPDFCGGPKNSCRSWTPPASPFYYTNEGGIFLLDDRQKYEERQKIELEHTLHELDARLQRLRETMSPPRFLSQLHEFGNPTLLPPSGMSYEPSQSFPRTPTEGLTDHSRVTSPGPFPRDCNGTPRRCKLLPTQITSSKSLHHVIDAQERAETGTTYLGKLIHTSLQHVQSTNSPPRYLARVSEYEAQPPPREAIPILISYDELRDEALVMMHASPQLHLGNTAYPTPLPSSPETKPRRKRGRDEGFQESSGRKRRCEEDDERILMHWRLRDG